MNILLVDDEQDCRAVIADFLRSLGHRIMECSDGQEALALCQCNDFDLVLSDINTPKISGVELLGRIRSAPARKKAEVVLFTGRGAMESAIRALRAGAWDYLPKPLDMEELAETIKRLAKSREVNEKSGDVRSVYLHVADYGHIGIFNESMRNAFRQALKFHKDRDMPVLIQGETGTGKEVIARLIHHGNIGSEAPFVDINCAALTPNLFESELFGYEAGAYTGGLTRGNKGKIDLASAGTLFLDEIGEMSIGLQAKLLRVVQEKEYYRVGGLQKVKTDARLICATNLDLEQKLEQGLFRKDLFYRLNVGRIFLSPLREIKEAIVPLAQMFLLELARKKGKRFHIIGKGAASLLRAYLWPGNIRELKNVIEWAVFNHDDEMLRPEHLGIIKHATVKHRYVDKSALSMEKFVMPETGFPLDEFSDEVVTRALEMHNGNKTKAALYLGISRRSLYCRLKRIAEKKQKKS